MKGIQVLSKFYTPSGAGNPTFMQHQTEPNKYNNKICPGREKGSSHLCLCMCRAGLVGKAGELSLWNALSLQEGTEQSLDTAYYRFQPSYFSQDILQAHDKLHVDKLHVTKLQNSKMYGWNESDSLEYKQASLRLSVNFMPGQKKVSIVHPQDKHKNVNGIATLFFP